MKNFIFTLFISLAFTAAAFAADYSVVIEDLPLMPGMTESAEQALVFDKPAGRIVETVATSGAASSEIFAWYASALPPLGWKAAGNNSYTREKEKLTLSAENGAVHFKISPLE